MKKGKRQKQSLKGIEARTEPEQERHHHHHPELGDTQKIVRLLTRIAEATEFIAKDVGRFFPSPEPVDLGPLPPEQLASD